MCSGFIGPAKRRTRTGAQLAATKEHRPFARTSSLSRIGALVVTLALAACASPGAVAGPRTKPAPQREPPNALTRLLPHKARPLCYASEGSPITFRLTDIPATAEPRTLTIRRVMLELARVEYPADALTPAETQHQFRMLLEAEGRKSRLMASGSCETETMHDFGCGVDCDGGSVRLELAQDGALTMRVSERGAPFPSDRQLRERPRARP